MKKLKILMAAAEVAPFAKVGGLADVLGSLPPALSKLGLDVRIIMPLYASVNREKYKLVKIKSDIKIASDNKVFSINLWQSFLPNTNLPVYFIEQDKYFGRKEVYFGNNSERFLFFSYAALQVLPIINFQPDIIHCHDYHTALIPNIIKASNSQYFENTKTIYTIHNLNCQGKSDVEVLSTGNLSQNSLSVLNQDAKNGDINFMVQGVLGADAITTVSKTYSREITTSVYGAHLEKVISKRKKDLYGIVNGIDINFFNPIKDNYIKQKFYYGSLQKKKINKLALQKKLGLPQSETTPLIGLVTRLVWQKGLELINEQIAKLDCQLVILGTGQKEYENALKKLARQYPKKISANITFDLELAQQIYASSDIFLVPSRFEPCGLTQMIAMRYGAIPVVRKTGGLADTVDDNVGFTFTKMNADAFIQALKSALDVYKNKPRIWQKMQKRAMQRDFSWNRSAYEYQKIYRNLLHK